MSTFTKQLLSGSTDGMGILVAQAATPGTTIHTAHATSKDEIWVWAINMDTAERGLTLEWGGATDPDNLIGKAVPIPINAGPILIVPGLILTNSKVLKAFAASANKLVLVGYVNRIG